MFGSARPAGVQANEDAAGQSFWKTFRRGDLASRRGQPHGGKAQFYPIYVNVSNGIIESIGDPIMPGVDRSTVPSKPGCMAVFPLRDDGTEMNWCTRKEAAEKLLSNGYIKAGGFNPRTEQKYPILYLRSGTIDDITAGKLIVDGYAEDHSIIAHYAVLKDQMPQTNWHIKEHSARDYGSNLLRSIFIEKRFIFPKSLYAVHDCIKLFVKHKKDALIVDFFAGSGTTLHAVNLLNAEDGGERRCIMVTNNEVSEAESKSLQAQGYHPGDTEWKRLGIARYVTWPRTQCTIKGENVKGQPLKGEYIGSEIPMADGFATNAEYFKLGFLDRDRVSLGQQFKEILPLLWLKAGAVGKRPEVEEAEPDMLILPENGFAVLVDETMYASFLQQVKQHPEIRMIFFVTDSEEAFREMSAGVTGCETFQLYRDYIDNFVLGSRRV
jgi:adenine-specific DNA-methyltransferase